MAEIRYTHGLSSVIKSIYFTDDGSPDGESNIKFQNRTFQLSVSYQLW